VTIDRPNHVAMPKLYGAPAHRRPPARPATAAAAAAASVDPALPLDPDDLPLSAYVGADEDGARDAAGLLAAQAGSDGAAADGPGSSEPPSLEPRQFSVRSLTHRIREPRGS
jgi:hypothetical protein